MTGSIVDQVADRLRRRTLAMDMGERLPPVRQLMATFGVSQLTLQKALGQLKDEGLVTASIGRGTFVGSNLQPAAALRNILVLTREQHTDRSDEVARGLHRALLKRRWRAAALSYSDFAQAVDLVRHAPGFDACVIHPRLETLPLSLLAALRSRGRAVVVEGYGVDGVDVDGIGVDWTAAVAIGMRHLMEIGHSRIGLVTLDRPVRAFSAVAAQFRVLHRWAALEPAEDPVILVPDGGEAEIYAHLTDRLRARRIKRRFPCTALLVYLGVYHGGSMLSAIEAAASGLGLAMLGFNDLATEHVGRLTTIGRSTSDITEAVAAAIERRWSEPAASYACRYLAPELTVRESSSGPP